MGIFTSKPGASVESEAEEDSVNSPSSGSPSEITFCLDFQPAGDPSVDDQTRLQGWAFSPGQDVFAELEVRGKVFSSQSCSLARHDVYSSFPQIPESLLSGFEFIFPPSLLSRLRSGDLELYLRAGEEKVRAWSLAESAAITSDPKALAVLADHFSAQCSQARTVIETTKRVLSGVEASEIHAVFASHGNISALDRNLSVLETAAEALLSSKVPLGGLTLGGLTIIADCEDDVPAITKLLKARTGLQNLKPAICTSEKLCSWRECGGAAAGTLIFYADESVVLDYLDFESFVRDFLVLPEASVLTPAVFGGEGMLHAPSGIDLSEYRSCTSIHGGDIPALFSVSKLSPTWICSRSFLEALENERFGGAKFGLCLPPSEKGYSYFSDLRQAICAAGGASYHYGKDELLQMQFLLDSQLESTSLANASGEHRVVFLIDENCGKNGPNSSERRQLLSLVKAVQAHAKVSIVVDSEDVDQPYFGGFSVQPLSALFEGRVFASTDTPDSKTIISTSWSTVRTASAARYVCDCRVFSYLQELSAEAFLENRFDDYDTARWALQAEFAQFTTSSWLAERATSYNATLDGMPVVACPADAESFRALPLDRLPDSVLLVIGETYPSLARVSPLIEALKERVPAVELRLLGGDLQGFSALDIAESMRLGFASADQDEAAMLYSRHQLVIDCTGLGPLSPVALEASACGAATLEVLPAEQHLSDKQKKTAAAALPLSEPAALAKEIANLLSSEKKRKELLESKVKAQRAEIKRAAPAKISRLLEYDDALVAKLQTERSQQRSASIIIPVYCALDATIQCIRSALKFAPENFEIIVVNDVSDLGTTKALLEVAESNPRITLINKSENGGFVQSCITGAAAARPDNDLILLNSDVVLTTHTLRALQKAAYARPRIALASSLSTNSPHLQIEINPGDSLEQAATKIRSLKEPEYPTVITPEGQLLYIRRWALEKFDFFDPVYNRGFCEESDLSMRMFLNGADMVVADDSLILHRKSESFGLEGGVQYKKENRPIFDARWAKHYWLSYPEFLRRDPLQSIRSRYKACGAQLEAPTQSVSVRDLMGEFSRLAHQSRRSDLRANVLDGVDVVFIIPSVILGGGTLSVLQHANELLLRGVEARVISLTEPDPIRFPYLAPPLAVSREQLMELNWTKQKVVATFWLTAYFVKAIQQRHPAVDGYYYIQDYEPWFYSRPDALPTIREAENSYELGLTGVAKTKFLRDTVKREHGIDIDIVTPGLARTVFYEGNQNKDYGRPTLTAYYRPRTPRRGGKETLEVLKRVKERVPEARLQLFGEDVELGPELEGVVESLGRLSQNDVSKLYRKSDVVMDLSFWHGFGRMGIESMASGAVPILSDSGGVRAYAEHEKNSYIVTLDNLDEAVDRTVRLLKDKRTRLRMRENGLKKVREFSESRAVDDWLSVMGIDAPKSCDEAVRFPGVAEKGEGATNKVVHLKS